MRSYSHLIWIGLFTLCLTSLLAREVICDHSIDAFDCDQPEKMIGRFDVNTRLEVRDYMKKYSMYQVVFTPPNGNPIFALCRASDLGLTANDTPLPLVNTEESEEGNENDQKWVPPVFQSVLNLDQDFWDLSASKFALRQSSYGFQWVSAADQSNSRSGTMLRFIKYPVLETLVKFNKDHLSEMTLLLYGRGDAQAEMSEKHFKGYIQKLEQSISHWLGHEGYNVPVIQATLNLKKHSWFHAPMRIDLVSSSTKEVFFGGEIGFRPEFIRLNITPYDGKGDIAELTKMETHMPMGQVVKLEDLKNRIQKDPGGDVYLPDIPMVDQGPKGYCVVAAAERVLSYYGLNIDQNILAKVSNTSTYGGTSPEEMIGSINKIIGNYSVITRKLKEWRFEDFNREVNAYNILARKKGKRSIKLNVMGSISPDQIYYSMDKDLFREARLQRSDLKKQFIENITRYIDKGTPLCWSVLLGFVVETPKIPQVQGGHMRLIIGYNEKTQELLYSDTWGAGHELKRMGMDNAYFITTGLYAVYPAL